MSEPAAQFFVSNALTLEVVGEDNHTETHITMFKEFWELQGKLNQTCAPLPEYESACTILGLNRYEPTLPGTGSMILKPWQVVGIAWMSYDVAALWVVKPPGSEDAYPTALHAAEKAVQGPGRLIKSSCFDLLVFGENQATLKMLSSRKLSVPRMH